MSCRLIAALALFVALALPASHVRAQEGFDLSTLRDGETLLHISATEHQQVTQDLLVARLSYFAEGEDPTKLQAEVNRAVTQALTTARTFEDVQVSTEGYHVYRHERYEPPPRPLPTDKSRDKQKEEKPVWRATQTLRLESTNSEQLLELAGKLQNNGLNMDNLSYQLSTAKRESVTDSLLTAALNKLQGRAQEAAQALGKTSASLVEVIANESGPVYPQPMMAMSARGAQMESAMPAPQAAPGTTEISLTVSARALLKP